MDIKSKRSEEPVPEEQGKDNENYSGKNKFKKVITSGVLRSFAFLLTCVMGFCILGWAMEYDENQNNVGYYFEDEYTLSEEYLVSKDHLYQALCATATVYLRNFEDGEFAGSQDLLKNFMRTLKNYEYSDKVRIYSENGVPVIESDFFDYYVSFGDNSITNIDGLKGIIVGDSQIENFKTGRKCWYVRRKNAVETDSSYQSDDIGENYVYSDFPGSGVYYDTEVYSISSVPIGWSGYDSFGRYILCYGPYENMYVYDFDVNDPAKAYIVRGYETIIVDSDDTAYSYYETYFDSDYNSDGSLSAYVPIDDSEGYVFEYLDDNDITVMISPNQEMLAEAEMNFSATVNSGNKLIVRIIVAAVILAACVIYLIAVCGYQGVDGAKWKYAAVFGRWHTEFLIAGIAVAFTAAVFLLAEYQHLIRIANNLFDIERPYSFWLLSGAVTFLCAVVLGFVLGAVSKLKMHSFWKDFYIFKLCRRFFGWIGGKLRKSGVFAKYDSQSVSRKLYIRQWIFTGVTILAAIILYDYAYTINSSLSNPIELIAIIAYIAYFIWFVITQFKIYRDIDSLDNQIDMMSRGEEFNGSIAESSPVFSDSRKLSEISENVKETVEKQVQSERMKIELVTNVSHDLKTPLTSIISYIDLLKAEDLPDEAMDYVRILEQKSDKLKNIVADVFSLAKATSGVDIDMENLDAVILLNQALADAGDKIEKSGRQMKINIEPKSAMITADGNKLYRVFQNLIDNALNYSMEGTRIFVDLKEEKDYIRLEMKNTASYEMNFTPEEITERFTRGDQSRTDGGNGLGLSIAKTFTEACGGAFRIELDGDVFKAVILLQKCSDTEES